MSAFAMLAPVLFLALNPLTAALVGWALLGEVLHPAVLGALALIAAGLRLAARPASTRLPSA